MQVDRELLELRGKHWAVLVKVVGFLTDLALIDRRTDIADVLAKLLDERGTGHCIPLGRLTAARLAPTGRATTAAMNILSKVANWSGRTTVLIATRYSKRKKLAKPGQMQE
jgi:hypothetical protein